MKIGCEYIRNYCNINGNNVSECCGELCQCHKLISKCIIDDNCWTTKLNKEEAFHDFTRNQKSLYDDVGTELMCRVKDPVEIAQVLELLAIEMRVDGNGKCR